MARPLVAISLCVGLGYVLLDWGSPSAAIIAVKGAAVGLLALAAASRARSLDQWILAALLGLGATGDVLIELSLAAGAAAFAAAHVASIMLYRRNRRPAPPRDWWLAALLLAVTAALPALLLRGRPEALAFTGYSLLLGTMAASAWLSTFPRRLVGAGALLFLISDMLIAARIGLEPRTPLIGPAIWLLYYFGQLLICVGISRSLDKREAA